MSHSPRIVQITDSHLGADWLAADPADTLRAVLAAIADLPDPPDAIVHTGDVTNDGRGDQYAAFAEVIGGLAVPLLVLPGNHDDRAMMRAGLGLAGKGADPVQSALELGALRVIGLDTVIPGEPRGALDAARLGWLAEQLADAPATPTLLALHHPPFETGLAGMDGIGLAPADRVALERLLHDQPQVLGLIAGHVHRAIASSVAGRPAVTIPGTYAQNRLDFAHPQPQMVAEPLAFAVHQVLDGRLVSHTQPLPPAIG